MPNLAVFKEFLKDRKKVVLLVFSSIFIFLISALGTYVILGTREAFVDTGDSYLPIAEQVEPVDLEEVNKDDGIFNILILGYGGAGHDGGFLTDTMMVAHVDTTKKKILLISLPRDTWVPLPIRSDQNQNFKINHAYAIGTNDSLYSLKEPHYKGESGPGNMTKYAVHQVTGLEIDHFAAVDFQGLVNIVDRLGGVSVDVPVAFDDYYYPIKGFENETCGFSSEKIEQLHRDYSDTSLHKQFTCRYEHLSFDQGVQQMDGQTVLKFVRSRNSAQHGGDFARGKRNQAVVLAFRDKLMSLQIINDAAVLFDRFSSMIKTDLRPGVLATLIKEYGGAEKYEVKTVNLTDENVFSATTAGGGQFVLVPKAGMNNFSGVQEFIAREIAGL